jgi:hypothetical protein
MAEKSNHNPNKRNNMAAYNLDATLRDLRERAGWCTKKEAHFVSWLQSGGHIKESNRPGQRLVEDIYKKKDAFESETTPYEGGHSDTG